MSVRSLTFAAFFFDYDLDGRLDIFAANGHISDDINIVQPNVKYAQPPHLFHNLGGNKFEDVAAKVGRALPQPVVGRGAAYADIDNDGDLDLAVTSTGFRTGPVPPLPSDRLTLLFGDGRGGFRRSDVQLRRGHTWFAAIGDVNNDRNPDVVTSHGDAPLVSVVLGDGRGNFAETAGSPFNLGQQAHYVALVDVNRDGQLDVIGAAGTSVRGLMGDGRGGFTPAPTSPFAPGRGMWKFAVADVNADGKADVVGSNIESDSVTVLLGR
jgi:hypothetical protein